jgi:hypothetical protein
MSSIINTTLVQSLDFIDNTIDFIVYEPLLSIIWLTFIIIFIYFIIGYKEVYLNFLYFSILLIFIHNRSFKKFNKKNIEKCDNEFTRI